MNFSYTQIFQLKLFGQN